MIIDVFSDTICPWCLIGKRRLERALAQRPELDVRIRWHGFQLNPWMPTEGMERGDYLAAKFGERDATGIYENIRRIGAAEGIDFRFDLIPRTPNTLQSHRLVRFAATQGRQNETVEALFQAYFIEGRDIGKLDVLVEVGAAAGLPADEVRAWLGSGAGEEAVVAEDSEARRMGIQGVPLFIVAGQYAISGAQEPEYFLPLLDLVTNGEGEADPATRSVP